VKIRVCIAGATGWAGSALARAVAGAEDLTLVGGVSRRHAGKPIAEVLGAPGSTARLSATVSEALDAGCDVFVEYTSPQSAAEHVAEALGRGVHVVIGTSGLPDDDLERLGDLAGRQSVGLLAVGNFSIAALVLARCAEIAARRIPRWEILDYAHAGKPDAPSGTARELAHRLSKIRAPRIDVPIAGTRGPIESRGASLGGTQVHSIRLPGYLISTEVIFGERDQRLSLRYDSGSGPEAYVDGALAAIRGVRSFVGLRRGLDAVIDLEAP
jgi:4-hydroxy-tetrahydrodipicolinate reductase